MENMLVRFYKSGSKLMKINVLFIQGFDTNQPTSHSGGKGEAIAMIKKINSFELELNSNEEVTMIGDGITDFEACPPANYFIGKFLMCIFIHTRSKIS